MYIDHNGNIALRLTIIEEQQLLKIRQRSFSHWGRKCFSFHFANKGSQYFVYDTLQTVAPQISQDTRPRIVAGPLTLILRQVYPHYGKI